MGQADGRALGVAEERFPSAECADTVRYCSILVCKKRTSDQKPYCLDHFYLNKHAKHILEEMKGMTPADVFGPPDPYAEPKPPPKEKRREMIPVEVQVGETRFWVGMIRARGIEKDPAPTPATSPRRLRPDLHVRMKPFTRLLTKEQSHHVLLLLQEHRAGAIPRGWLVSDNKFVNEALKKFSSKKR